MQITLTPIGYVRATRANPTDDNWDSETTRIELDTSRFNADALLRLDTYSHVEVLYWFHHTEAATPTLGARHPRGNTAWPLAGVFAQRGKNRPNRLGSTICRVVRREGRRLVVAELDAIEGIGDTSAKAIACCSCCRIFVRACCACVERSRRSFRSVATRSVVSFNSPESRLMSCSRAASIC